MSALSRRTVLRATAASVALAAPAAAVSATTPEAVDPVVVLFAQWQTACQALYDYREAQHAIDNYDDDEISESLWLRHDQLVGALLFAQATTWQGVLTKIRIASWSSENSPYECPGVTGDMDQRFVFSAHADAERLAGGAVMSPNRVPAFGAPFDPFQLAAPPASDPMENLARRWIELTRQIDDDAFELADQRAENARNDALWEERNEIETQLETEAAEPTLVGIALKLRSVAWHLNVENAECANRDGVRTNELDSNEKIIASAIADAERIMGRAQA